MGFTIDKISWHTTRPGEPDPLDEMVDQFWAAVRFLQAHGLTTRILAHSREEIHEDFEIGSDDLTAEGMQLIRASYEPWVRRVERTGNAEDVQILERGLARIRGQ